MKTDLTQSRQVAKKTREINRNLSSCFLGDLAALRETLRGMIVVWCLFFLAASAASAQPEKPTRQSGDKAIEARRILKAYCGECHGKNPTSHPAGSQLSILEYNQLIAPSSPNHPLPFVVPKNAKQSHLLALIECGSMPPGGKMRPTPEEVAKLRDWIETAAPAYPAEFNDRYVLEQILADYERSPQDAEHVRYVSYAHLIVNDQPDSMLGQFTQRRLNVAMQLSSIEAGDSQPIDGCATVYRYDLRRTGLLQPDQFYVVIDGMAKKAAVRCVAPRIPVRFLDPRERRAGPAIEALHGEFATRPAASVRSRRLAGEQSCRVAPADATRADAARSGSERSHRPRFESERERAIQGIGIGPVQEREAYHHEADRGRVATNSATIRRVFLGCGGCEAAVQVRCGNRRSVGQADQSSWS